MINIQTVTVIGANGTMGRNISAIFASFGNAKVYLVSRTEEKSVIAKNKAYKSVRAESIKERMIPADYDRLEECVNASDLVFEACKEDWNIKSDVHRKISEIVERKKGKKLKFICSGTSGLSITKLAELYPEQYRGNIIGMHFFNPPYQMILCELVWTKYTDLKMFHAIKNYASSILRRTVVEVKDSPAFLGNRIGFQFINEVLLFAEKYKYNGGIDYMDAILGAFTGRAMPPLVTTNFVGLDVHKAIVDNLWNNTNDYAHNTFVLPGYVKKLIENGKLGKKKGMGLYRTIVRDSGIKIKQVYDIEQNNYRETMKYIFPFAESMIRKIRVGNYEGAFRTLVQNRAIEAEICCQFLLKYILYSFISAEIVCNNVHSADDVMAAGFNWCPPLALLEALGGKETFYGLCKERLDEGIVSNIDMESVSSKIEKSEYDYRRYFKAKR